MPQPTGSLPHRTRAAATATALDAIPPIRGTRGRPRRRPLAVYADRGYDHDCYRRQGRAKGIKALIARRGTEHDFGLGTKGWVIEQTIAYPRCVRSSQPKMVRK